MELSPRGYLAEGELVDFLERVRACNLYGIVKLDDEHTFAFVDGRLVVNTTADDPTVALARDRVSVLLQDLAESYAGWYWIGPIMGEPYIHDLPNYHAVALLRQADRSSNGRRQPSRTVTPNPQAAVGEDRGSGRADDGPDASADVAKDKAAENAADDTDGAVEAEAVPTAGDAGAAASGDPSPSTATADSIEASDGASDVDPGGSTAPAVEDGQDQAEDDATAAAREETVEEMRRQWQERKRAVAFDPIPAAAPIQERRSNEGRRRSDRGPTAEEPTDRRTDPASVETPPASRALPDADTDTDADGVTRQGALRRLIRTLVK